MRNRTKNTKLESHFQQRKGRIVSESDHTVTMDFKRGSQIISKRDIPKTKPKSTSYSPKTIRQRGDSKSLERKIAALKEAEQRASKSTTPTKQKTATAKQIGDHRLPRKQAKPRRSLAGLPETHKKIEILDTSSDEEESKPENKQNQMKKKKQN